MSICDWSSRSKVLRASRLALTIPRTAAYDFPMRFGSQTLFGDNSRLPAPIWTAAFFKVIPRARLSTTR